MIPAANRFSRTSGVLPILAALSAKKFDMNSPLNGFVNIHITTMQVR